MVVYLKSARIIRNVSFYCRRLNCLSGFDFERGKVSRRTDFTHCYFYNSLEHKWLECAWFGKYGISKDFKAYFRAPLKIWQSPTVARMYSRHPVMCSQDQVCDSNHAECVLFSQSPHPNVTQRHAFYSTTLDAISFATILDSLYVRSLCKLKSCASIQWPTARLVRELIADCFRSFMNKGHVVKSATKLPALSFHLEKLRLCL